MIKQHGYLLAKGFLTGLQFERLFEDGLYLSIGKTAVALADRVRRALTEKGYEQPMIAPTNQVFVTFRNDRLQALQQQVRVSFWEAAGPDSTVVRIATDWATTEADVEALLALL
jgi:threonine aldolase